VRRVFSNGRLDLPLTDRGRQQASLAARWLAAQSPPPTHVFSAPLLRARQTAEIVAAQLGADGVTVVSDLDEVRVGDLDARDDDAAWTAYDVVMSAWLAGTLNHPFPGGETLHDAVTRYERALRHIAAQAPDETVAVATHGGIQLTALPRLCADVAPGQTGLPHAAITRLEVTPGAIACRLWASTAHLGDSA
jgi:probable phosphoglycerate mutase